MNNQITDVPMSVRVKEAERGIIDEINKYNLPPFLLELILKNIYAEAVTLANRTYEMDRVNYLNSVNAEKESSEITEATEETVASEKSN